MFFGRRAEAGARTTPDFGHATKWATVDQVVGRAIALLGFLLIARLIEPTDYGQAMFAVALVTIVELLVDGGLSDTILAGNITQPRRLARIFSIQAGLGCVLSLGLALASDPLAAWAGMAAGADVLLLLAVMPLAWGLSLTSRALLRQHLDYRAMAVRTLLSGSIGVGIGLTMAAQGAGPLAVAAQFVATQCLGAVLSVARAVHWFGLPLPEGLATVRPRANTAFDFLAVSLLGVLGARLPEIAVGRFLGAVALGSFAAALRLVYTLRDLAFMPSANVLFVWVARRRASGVAFGPESLAKVRVLALLLAPLFFVSALLHDDLVAIALGPEWSAVGPPLAALCFAGFFTGFNMIQGTLLRASGRARILVAFQAVGITTDLVLVWQLAPMGLLAICVALSARGITWCALLGVLMAKSDWRGLPVGRSIFLPLAVGSAALVAAAAPLLQWMPAGLLRAVVVGAVACLAYGLTLLLAFPGLRGDARAWLQRRKGTAL